MTAPTKTPTLTQLIAHARKAHAAINGADALGQVALAKAFDAGDALIAAKARVPHGEWAATVEKTGIPASTARLYMQLARNRDRIVAAGCKSIREARTLLTDRKPPRKRRAGRPRSSSTAPPEPVEDRYEEGYAAGYARGRMDEREYHTARRPVATQNGNGSWSPAPADLKWILKRVHPDVVEDKDSLKATRVAQWLNELLEHARSTT
jgi:hypothetical protein